MFYLLLKCLFLIFGLEQLSEQCPQSHCPQDFFFILLTNKNKAAAIIKIVIIISIMFSIKSPS
ncbi:MAG: hypothetical protein K0R06_1336 [Clostridium sp.]|jgi:hypothetical protein|nr:hypothetical protein [Clostridium sp.]